MLLVHKNLCIAPITLSSGRMHMKGNNIEICYSLSLL